MAGGTKIADVYVDLGLALTEYRKGLTQAKTEARNIGAEIRSALAGKPLTGTSGIASLIEDLKLGGSRLQAFQRNLPAVGRDLAKLSVSGLTTSLNALQGVGTRVFGNLKNLAGTVFKGFALGVGIGAFLSLEQAISRVIRAIPDLINKGRDYANEVDQISDVTGAATEDSAKLASVLNFLGQDVGTVFIRLGQLSKTVKDQEVTLNRLGVVTRDINGDFLNQVQLIDSIRSSFSGMADGTRKARLEVLLFGGRGGLGQLIDYLNLTDEQMAALTAQFEKQGLLVSQSTRQLGEEALRAGKNLDNSFTGLATTLFATVAPQIVSFLDGIAAAVAENAQKIADFVAGIVSTIIGLVEGLTGIEVNFNSFTHSVEEMAQGTSNTSFRLVSLQEELDGLQKALNPAGEAASDLNDRITAGSKAFDAEGVAIDKTIAKLNKMGETRGRVFERGLAALTRTLDLETQLFDAEDKAAARADRDLQQTRTLRDAKIALFEAQAQLRQNALEGESTDQDVLNIAKAQEALLDAQRAIGDEVRDRAQDDRRAQIAAVKEYVAEIEKIVETSENKKAALANLTTRKTALEEQLAAATAKGAAQEVADLKIKLGAVDAGIVEENAKIKQGAAIDELTARKEQLAEMKKALQDERTSEAAINREATRIAIAAKEEEIKKERERIAASTKNRAAEIKDTKLFGTAITGSGGEGGLVGAFNESREAGLRAASEIKAALIGSDGKGGVLGAIGSIAAAIGHIFDGLTSAWDAIPKELRGVVLGAIAGGAVGGPVGAAAGAITGGAIQLGAVDAGTDAQKKALLEQTLKYAQTASLADLQDTWKALIKKRDEAKTAFGTETTTSVFIAQLVDILAKEIGRKFGGNPPPGMAGGGWLNKPGLYYGAEKGREYVLDHRLSEMLARMAVAPQMPQMATAGPPTSGTLVVEHLSLDLGGSRVIDLLDQKLAYRRRG